MADVVPRRYRFGPRNRRGLIVGIAWEQAVLLVTTLGCSVFLLRVGGGRVRVLESFVTLIGGCALALWPVGGRTVQGWLPVIGRFVATGLSGGHRAVSTGQHPRRAGARTVAFRDLSIGGVPGASGEIGVLYDRSRWHATGVLRITGESFALLDDATRQHTVDSFAAVLAAVAQHPGRLRRLAWLEQTVPDHALALLERANDAEIGRGTTATSIARDSYLALVRAESGRALRHECHLAVTVACESRLSAPSSESVAAALDEVAARCQEVGLAVEGALSPAGLRTLVRRATSESAMLGGDHHALPLAIKEQWSSLCTDGTWHATYWVAEWPRVDVGNDFLLPLLLQPGLRRTAVVVMQPTPQRQAMRAAERARTENTADGELRRRHGFALTARSAREQDAVTRREVELAAGHGAYRFAGYIGVTATSPDELEQHCGLLEQSAAVARLSVRRLYGTQQHAFTFLLPAGRGL